MQRNGGPRSLYLHHNTSEATVSDSFHHHVPDSGAGAHHPHTDFGAAHHALHANAHHQALHDSAHHHARSHHATADSDQGAAGFDDNALPEYGSPEGVDPHVR